MSKASATAIPPAEARHMLETALGATHAAPDPPVSKSFGAYHAFIRSRIRDLNDADEVGIERHEERGEPKERNDETQCARHRIAVDDHSGAKDQHQKSKDPK